MFMVEEVEKVKEMEKEERIVVVVRREDLLEKKIAKILLQILYLVIMRMLMPRGLTKNNPQEKKAKTEI